MQLASFLAPSLKTMDSLVQMGRESFKLDPGVALDLHFRVIKVRLWGTSTLFAGVQFIYRHCVTEEEREGVLLVSGGLATASPSPLEISLLEEEYIAHVQVVRSPQQPAIVSGVMLITSASRRFHIGAPAEEMMDTPKNLYTEIRELRGQLSPGRDAFINVTPVTMLQPNAEAIQAIVNEAVEAASTKWWYPERCEQLAGKLRDAGDAVQGVVARSILYPVGILCEFGEIAQLSKAVLVSCGQALAVDYFAPRGLVIDGYISRLEAVFTSVDERIPKVELEMLNVGDPVDYLDVKSIPRMVRQALKTSQHAIATTLCVKYPAYLVEDEALVHRMVEVLVETDECGQMIHVVEGYTQAAYKSTATFMSRYKLRQPSLIERAIYREDPVLLEWLVREAHLDPFEAPLASVDESIENNSDGEMALSQVATTLSEARKVKRDSLFDLVECVKDKGAQERMRILLTHIKKKDDFQNGLVILANKDQVSALEFQELVPHITSVYDLPLLFSQATSSLGEDTRGLTVLVQASCDHVIEHKLVLDTMGSAFFNVALRQASEHGFLTPLEHEHYRILNSQINMESAAWVVELKRTTDHIQWRVNRLDDQVESLQRNVQNLRDSLRRNEEIELNRRKTRRNLALLSSMLVMVGGGTAVYALQDMFEPVDPTLLISSGEEHFMDGVKSTASDLLESSSSDVNALLSRMSSGISLGAQGLVGLDLLRGLGAGANKTEEIVGAISSAAELCNLKSVVQHKKLTFDEKKLRLHPYHHAVVSSRGDLQQFMSMETTLGPQADVNDEFEITVTKLHNDGKTTTTTMPMVSYIMASHLGFVEIVDYLLTHKNLRKREWKLTTKRRARKAQASNTRRTSTTSAPP